MALLCKNLPYQKSPSLAEGDLGGGYFLRGKKVKREFLVNLRK